MKRVDTITRIQREFFALGRTTQGDVRVAARRRVVELDETANPQGRHLLHRTSPSTALSSSQRAAGLG
jgi:hypothetical protein